MIEAPTPQKLRVSNRKRVAAASLLFCGLTAIWLFNLVKPTVAQSGRTSTVGKRTTVINVIAHRVDDPNKPKTLLSGATKKEEEEKVIPKQAIEIYDGGVRQEIQSFSPDPTPARIVVVMDN